MGNPRDRPVVGPPNTPDQSGVQWHYMLSEQELIELANNIGTWADDPYGYDHEVTATGNSPEGNPRIEVGFKIADADEIGHHFVVSITSVEDFRGHAMVFVNSDDGDWYVTSDPKAIANIIFNSSLC